MSLHVQRSEYNPLTVLGGIVMLDKQSPLDLLYHHFTTYGILLLAVCTHTYFFLLTSHYMIILYQEGVL